MFGRLPRVMMLLAFAVFCVVPLLWLVLAPSKSNAGLADEPPLSFGSFEGYLQAWQHLVDYGHGVIFHWMWNSVWYSVTSLVVTVAVCLMAGYSLAVSRIPLRKPLLILTLVAMMIPPTALVLPLFLEFSYAKLINSPLSVILPASFYPFGVYLAFIYFSTTLPRGLVEAARIDGCSESRVFSRIALPLATPLVGLLAFFSFVANWSNYFLPYVMLSQEDRYNLPVGLGALIAGTPALRPAVGGSQLPITRPEVALAGLIVVVPIAIIFVFCQRYLVRGILAGSVKE
ncbi:MAG: ABC transporter permease [Candidatus Lumbricidophila eiseniae]|uniref:ABC transporter permease n=1 Tax=Candidatus Lumbricidiphila eiseniae TaxID=1969409 RepID=A0A2A6FUD9_9MICO|nr:MAG: ABC transporter permease [Candidatus Lumbricidophila eiseniae]